MISLIRTSLVFALMTPSSLPAQYDPGLPRTRKPTATTREITVRDLMTRIYIFADDSMGGRLVGTADNVRANAYIARELQRLGLKPAGENGTFFQTVPYVTRVPSASLRLGADSLVMGTDFAPLDARRPLRDFNNQQVVFGGSVADMSSFISEEQARGKVVLVNGLTTRRIPQLQGAAAVIFVGTDAYFTQVKRFITRPNAILKPADTTLSPALFAIPPSAASRVLGAPLEGARPGQLGPTLTGRVAFTEVPAPAQNVIGILPGRDPRLRAQYVAVGSHNDHVGYRRVGPLDHDSVRAYNTIASRLVVKRTGQPPSSPGSGLTPEERASIRVNVDSLRRIRPVRLDSIYNGADDDASGSMAMLEIAEYYAKAKVKPRRSLLFIWHTGEEAGLDGSEFFTDNPTVPRDSIVAQLNLDMVGRGGSEDATGGGPNYLQLLGSRRLSKEMGDLVESINLKRGFNYKLDYQYDAPGNPLRYYCRSDHWNYARYGIPITFFSTGDHPDYHQLTDEPQYINYANLTKVSRFIGSVMEEVANRDRRLVLDRPKPSPNDPCVQ